MKKYFVELKEIKLVGIKVRTNNDKEFNTQTAKIGTCIQKFFSQDLVQIPDRKKPGVTFCAYTEYESDHTGGYTFFIAEEVNSINEIPLNMHSLIIPPQKYIKFTTEPGVMPGVVIDGWQKIWKMNPEQLGGDRNYKTDFEFYDHRAAESKNAVVDIFIGIK
ncbi:GyrI-like domain-containing protein [Rickettsia endosymbiont of Halotydeus destructor]|uniref:GyrI-like domain-containing protein n=1 Tax=Rickettsia endosymbiont of Halotydeus destructor TaxID=2996754 RepID=UPI003BB0637C